MLINVRISELVSETSNSIPLSLIIGILYISIVQGVLLYYYFNFFIVIIMKNNFGSIFSIIKIYIYL